MEDRRFCAELYQASLDVLANDNSVLFRPNCYEFMVLLFICQACGLKFFLTTTVCLSTIEPSTDFNKLWFTVSYKLATVSRLKSSVIAGEDKHFVHNNDERRSKYNSLETTGNASRALDMNVLINTQADCIPHF